MNSSDECFDLTTPTRPTISDVAVHEHQWFTLACTFISDPEPIHLDWSIASP